MDFKAISILTLVAVVGLAFGAPGPGQSKQLPAYCGPTLFGGPSTNPACTTTTRKPNVTPATTKPTQKPTAAKPLPACPASCCKIQCPHLDDGCAKKKSPVCYPADSTQEPEQGAYCHDPEAAAECDSSKCKPHGECTTACDKGAGRICPYVKLTPPLPPCPDSCCQIECSSDDVICKAASPVCQYTDGTTEPDEGKVCHNTSAPECDKTKCKPSVNCAAATDCSNPDALCPFV